jgi:hypothetical protein
VLQWAEERQKVQDRYTEAEDTDSRRERNQQAAGPETLVEQSWIGEEDSELAAKSQRRCLLVYKHRRVIAN